MAASETPAMKNKNKGTKFPVARIKKIMQKDEEVDTLSWLFGDGSLREEAKALELFLQHIVETSSKVTVSRGAKRLESYHLKHAINTNEMLDFLKEIVENVPDPTNGGTISESDGLNGEGKKRRKGRGPAKAKAKKEEDEAMDGGMDEDDDD